MTTTPAAYGPPWRASKDSAPPSWPVSCRNRTSASPLSAIATGNAQGIARLHARRQSDAGLGGQIWESMMIDPPSGVPIDDPAAKAPVGSTAQFLAASNTAIDTLP